MKHFTYLIIGLIFSINLHAQSFTERAALQACECLDSLETIEQVQDSLNTCTSQAIVSVGLESAKEENIDISTFQGIKSVLKQVSELIPSYCDNVRSLLIEEKKEQHYGLSANIEANEHYLKGNDLMEEGNYTQSIKAYKKAIKIDDSFVYAYDHLAVSYRRQENFKKAIKYYQKSLDIFPEGHVAIFNMAVCYSFLKEYALSLEQYEKLSFLYPNDPEGYFGAGKIQYLLSNYESALNNIFTAHRIYIETESDYVKDSGKLINIMYAGLKEKDKLDLFRAVAKQHNITINEEN